MFKRLKKIIIDFFSDLEIEVERKRCTYPNKYCPWFFGDCDECPYQKKYYEKVIGK